MTDRADELNAWIASLPEQAAFLARAMRRAAGASADAEVAEPVWGFHTSDPALDAFTAWVLTEHAFTVVEADRSGGTRVSQVALSRVQRVVETSTPTGELLVAIEADVERSTAVPEVADGGLVLTRTYPTSYLMREAAGSEERAASLRTFVDALRLTLV